MAKRGERVSLVQFYASMKDYFRQLSENELTVLTVVDSSDKDLVLIAKYDELGNNLAREVLYELKQHNSEEKYDITYEIDQLYTFIDTGAKNKITCDAFNENSKELLEGMLASSHDILLLSDAHKNPQIVFIQSSAYKTYKKKIIQRHVKLTYAKREHIKSLTQAQESLLKIAPKLSMFKNLNEAQIVAITKNTKFMHFEANETIFSQNDSSKQMYYILKGNISISVKNEKNNRSQEVARLGAGLLLGEMAFIMKQNRTAQARALSDTMALCFEFDEEFDDKGALVIFYKNLVNILSDKLISTNDKLTKLM